MQKPRLVPGTKNQTRPAETKTARKRTTPNIDNHIGKELRQLYASILEEPVPDRFLDLLNSFDAVIGSETPGDAS